MGPCDDGDDPAAVAETRRPDSRVDGSNSDIVALSVPSSPRAEAQFDLIGLRAPDLGGPVRSIGSQATQVPSR